MLRLHQELSARPSSQKSLRELSRQLETDLSDKQIYISSMQGCFRENGKFLSGGQISLRISKDEPSASAAASAASAASAPAVPAASAASAVAILPITKLFFFEVYCESEKLVAKYQIKQDFDINRYIDGERTILHHFVKGDPDTVSDFILKSLIDQSVCLDIQEATHIHLAKQEKILDEDLAKYLMDCGARYDIPDRFGLTALEHMLSQFDYEINSAHIEIIKAICRENGPDVILPNGSTLLHFAVEYQCEELVEFLLSAGADFEIKNSDGETVLDIVSDSRNFDLSAYYVLKAHAIKEGINPRGYIPRIGTTLLHLLLQNSSGHSLIEEIIEDGLYTTIQDRDGKTAIDLALELLDSQECISYEVQRLLAQHAFRADIRSLSPTGDTILHSYLKAKKCFGDTVKILLKRGAKYDVPNHDGVTALDVVIAQAEESHISQGGIKLLKNYIKKHGNTPFQNGYTPLTVAIKSGSKRLVEFIVLEEYSFFSPDGHGKTPLDVVLELARKDRLDYASSDVLEQYSLRIKGDTILPSGDTLMHLAVKSSDQTIVSRFLSEGCKYQIPNSYGETALSIATKHEVISKLNTGAQWLVIEDFITRTGYREFLPNGDKPLHFVVKYGTVEKIDEVMAKMEELGIDIQERNSRGQTALDVAMDVGYSQVISSGSFHFLRKSLGSQGLNTLLPNGNTLLHLMIHNGSFDDYDKLLEEGVRIDIPNKDGVTALQLALIPKDGCLTYIAEDLLLRYVKVRGANAILPGGNRLIYYFDKAKSTKFTKTLIKMGAKLDIKSAAGESPLDKIFSPKYQQEILKFNHPVVEAIVRNGIDMKVTRLGETLFHLAIRYNSEPLVKYLLRRLVKFDIKNSEGFTALDLALMLKDRDGESLGASKFLLESTLKPHKNVDVILASQETLLHKALKFGNIPFIRSLIERNANINIKNGVGVTALELALKLGEDHEISHAGICMIKACALKDGASIKDVTLPNGIRLIDHLMQMRNRSSIELLEFINQLDSPSAAAAAGAVEESSCSDDDVSDLDLEILAERSEPSSSDEESVGLVGDAH
jgi:ankyrin repeat protein